MEQQRTGTPVQTTVENVPTSVTAAAPAAVPVAADRTRWGPIWGGLITTFSVFLVLEALLFWAGGLALKTGTSGVVVNHPWITWVLALIAFFVGGVLTASTSAVRGPGVNMLNGFLVWALATSLFAVASFLGAGLAFGTVGGLIARFVSLSSLKHVATIAPTAVTDLRTAAGWALLTLVTTAIVAAFGGSLGGFGLPMGRVAQEPQE